LIWHCPTPERWGAFASGFEEVDENVEYEEREDEFDIVICVHLIFQKHSPILSLSGRYRGDCSAQDAAGRR
jgi:hypothetical protein